RGVLAAKPVTVPDTFVTTATGLRTHLAAMGIELTVALLPAREGVVQDATGSPWGVPQTEWTKSGGLLADAEAKLKAQGITVCPLLPLLHEDLVRYPDKPLFRDAVHLNHLGISSVGRRFAQWAGWRHGTEDGSSTMWLGDCNVTHIRRAQEEKGFGHPKVLWRNGSAHQMAHELSLLDRSELEGVRRIVWLVESVYLESYVFPPVATGSRAVVSEGKTCLATLTKPSRFPADLGPSSPYPDAVTVIAFRSDDGTEFMGLADAMTKHVINEAVQKEWITGSRFRLTLKPWEQACKEAPGLANIRQLDDQTNFTAPRYWISHWQRLD
ncbi:MAG: hypothetical protein ACOYMN_26095, partial [Roseimicrobium sp.]